MIALHYRDPETQEVNADFPLPMKPYLSGLPEAANEHTRIHAGRVFAIDFLVSSLADNASATVAVTTGSDQYPHVAFLASLNGNYEALIYEGASITGGTPVTAYNHKRYSTNTFLSTCLHSPTVNATGTLINQMFIAGGERNQATGGSSGAFGDEWILNQNLTYLFRITNKSGQASECSINLLAYNSAAIPDR